MTTLAGSTGAVGPILRTRDEDASKPTNWATQAGQAVHFERFFYTSDFRCNVSAIVSSGDNLIEQYRYSATGVPFGIARGDVNADGLVGTPRGGGGGGGGVLSSFTASGNADYDQAVYLVKNRMYEVRADWNLDGKINAIDTAVAAAAVGTATGRKTMSAVGVGNRAVSNRDVERFDSGLLASYSSLVITKISVALSRLHPDSVDPFDFDPILILPTDFGIPLSPTGFPPNTLGPVHESTTLRSCYKGCVYVDKNGTNHADPVCMAACDSWFPREDGPGSRGRNGRPPGGGNPGGGGFGGALTPPPGPGDCKLRIRSKGGIINHFWIEWDDEDGTHGVGFWPGTSTQSPVGPGHWFPGRNTRPGDAHNPKPGDSDPWTGSPRQDGDGSQSFPLCFAPGTKKDCAAAKKCLQNYRPGGSYCIAGRHCQGEAIRAMQACGLMTCWEGTAPTGDMLGR